MTAHPFYWSDLYGLTDCVAIHFMSWQLSWIWLVIHISVITVETALYSFPSSAQLAGAVEYTNCISVEEKDSPNECPEYDTKWSDGEVQVMLELWGMRSTPSLPLVPGPLWHGEVTPDRVLFRGKRMFDF